MKRVAFFRFSNGQSYTIANEIERYALTRGYSSRIDPDGSRHPGSVCNAHLKEIMGDRALRKKFNLKSSDVVQVSFESPENSDFKDWLLDRNYVHPSAFKGNRLDLYSVSATNAILCSMFRTSMLINETEMVVYQMYTTGKCVFFPKRLDKERLRPVNSLIAAQQKKQPVSTATVISSLSEDEQAAVRKYQTLVKETRDNGRRVSRRTKKA